MERLKRSIFLAQYFTLEGGWVPPFRKMFIIIILTLPPTAIHTWPQPRDANSEGCERELNLGEIVA